MSYSSPNYTNNAPHSMLISMTCLLPAQCLLLHSAPGAVMQGIGFTFATHQSSKCMQCLLKPHHGPWQMSRALNNSLERGVRANSAIRAYSAIV